MALHLPPPATPAANDFSITGCELDATGAIILRNSPGSSPVPTPFQAPAPGSLRPYKTDAAGHVLAGAIYRITMCHTPANQDTVCLDAVADIGDAGDYLANNLPWGFDAGEDMSFTFTELVTPAGFALAAQPVTCTCTAVDQAWRGCTVDAFNRVFLVDQPGSADVASMPLGNLPPLVYKTDPTGRVIAGERFDVEACVDSVVPCTTWNGVDLPSDGSWMRHDLGFDPNTPVRVTFTETMAPVGFVKPSTRWVCTYTPSGLGDGRGTWSGCNVDAAGRVFLTNQPVPTPVTPTPTPVATPAPTTVPAPTQTAPRLVLAKRALRANFRAGALATYTLRISNTGTADATDVVMCDILPAATSVHTAPGARMSTGKACWRLGTLAPGRAITKRITLRIATTAQTGRLVNNATATSPSVAGVRYRAKAGVTVRPRVAAVRAPAVTG